MLKRALLFVFTSLSLFACGPRGQTGIPEGREKAWAELDHDERMEHMAVVVMPRMRSVFQGHDSERFAEFTCATCHGGGANSGEFHMPNPDLPQLDAANLYKQHRKESPDMVKLMWKEVEPAMGEALALTYGFGGEIECGSCHMVINEKE
jgi:hypothetical protein